MLENPLASIIINNYNYGRFLPKAIDSAIAQTYNNIEIIVVDDGSTDHSRELIESYGEQVIAIFQANNGHASTFNAGFAASKGEVVFFLDADDIFELNKVEKVVQILTADEPASWYFHALQLFDSKTEELLGITLAFPNQSKDTSGYYDFRKTIKQGQLEFYPPSTSGLCFKRSLLDQILPMPEALSMAADRYLVLTAMLLEAGYFLQAPLTRQGIHGDNAITLQNNITTERKRARNEMIAAYFLRQKFPSGSKFSHRTFARGWGTSRLYGFISDEAKQVQEQYLSSVSWWEKMAILAVSWYQNRPWKEVSFYR